MASTTTITAPPAPTTTTSTTTKPSSQPTRLPPSTTEPKPTPYTFSLSYLCATDPNPLPPTPKLMSQPRPEFNSQLQTIARDGTQSLITALLTTTTIHSTSDGVSMLLPQISNTSVTDQEILRLPRWKPLPKRKEPTKWETFAKKKGIGKYGSAASGGAKLEERRKNMVYDEESGEWVKKWGYKGKNMKEGQEWLVEVDDDKKRKAEEKGDNVRTEGKRERMERMRRQERRERNNGKRRGKVGG